MVIYFNDKGKPEAPIPKVKCDGEKHYEVAIRWHKDLPDGKDDGGTFDFIPASNYRDAVKIAKYWSSPEHKHEYVGQYEASGPLDEVWYASVICWTETESTSYSTLFLENYDDGKRFCWESGSYPY